MAKKRTKKKKKTKVSEKPTPPSKLYASFKRSVSHIAKYGDTDIYPNTVEKYIFHDKTTECTLLLDTFWKEWSSNKTPSEVVRFSQSDTLLASSGFRGFRWATQLDPWANAYLLGLVVHIGKDIEERRSLCEKDVYSYRFVTDRKAEHIFNQDRGWREFRRACKTKAMDTECKYVVSCDVADFYPRVYHHTIENELQRSSKNHTATKHILEILKNWSRGASYGLPIGGDAARLLAELVLNVVDENLTFKQINFCRFVDDYVLFARTQEEAHAAWITLSGLLRNEGLTLQKSKTLIETSSDFQKHATYFDDFDSDDSTKGISDISRLMLLKIRFDPYSDTAEEDYESIKKEVSKIDLETILRGELEKSRVDQSVVKRIVKLINYIDVNNRAMLILGMLESIDSLFPILPTILHAVKQTVPHLSDDDAAAIFQKTRELFTKKAFLLKIPINTLHAIRLLALDPSPESGIILSSIFSKTTNASVKRDIIYAMGNRNMTSWLKDIRQDYDGFQIWLKDAFIMASYFMTDEGSHWRRNNKFLSKRISNGKYIPKVSPTKKSDDT